MDTVKGQVVSIADRQVSVVVLTGDYKDKLYGLVPGPEVEPGQFVEIQIHAGGFKATWPA